MPTSPRGPRVILLVLLSFFVVYIFAEIARNPDQRQWDFRTYYYAALTQASGGNPYDVAQLNSRADGLTVPPFIYPPPTLTFFKLFAAVPYTVAYQLWFALKLLLAAILIFLWRKYLFPDEPAFVFYLFLLLAFGATFYIDFVTGNMTVIEQVLLWLGIVFLLRGRPLAFCVTVVFASAFKLTPIVFLFLLPLVGARHAWRYFVGAIAVAAAATGLAYFLDPGAWGQFFATLSVADEAGQLGNPSTLSLCRDLIGSIADKWGTTIPGVVPVALYAIVIAGILWVSAQHLRILKRPNAGDPNLIVIFLFCLAVALAMPRFKTYSFMLLLPPAYYTIRNNARLPAFGFLVALLALSASTPFPVSPYLRMFWTYYPLFLAVLVWGLLLHHIRTRPSSRTP